MALTITAAEVRSLLVDYTTVDITDAQLASAGHIVLSQAYITKILSNNSLDYDEMDTTDAALAKGLCLIHCAKRAINKAPAELWKHGPVEFKGVGQKKVSIDAMDKDFNDISEQLGLVIVDIDAGEIGGDDYVSDSENLKNIDYYDTENVFSRST